MKSQDEVLPLTNKSGIPPTDDETWANQSSTHVKTNSGRQCARNSGMPYSWVIVLLLLNTAFTAAVVYYAKINLVAGLPYCTQSDHRCLMSFCSHSNSARKQRDYLREEVHKRGSGISPIHGRAAARIRSSLGRALARYLPPFVQFLAL